MTDEPEYVAQKRLTDEIATGETRRSLIALRDYVAHELEGNRCTKCAMSQLRTGDTASLVLRLQKIIEDIAALPAEQDPEADAAKGVVNLATIRNRHADDRGADSSIAVSAQLGTKGAPRRGGSRRKSG